MSETVVVKRRGSAGCVILLFLFLGILALLITIRAMGYVTPLYVSSADMAPAISAGDHVLVENFTYKSHAPQRGDVVVFHMDKGQALDPGTYVLRIVGMPGEKLSLTEDGLKVDDKPLVMRNMAGKIHYGLLDEAVFLSPKVDSVMVPKDNYFLMGDNTNGSKDSRFWGFLPTDKVTGKVSLIFWPSTKMGMVK
jgi:signal peptidase I